MPSKNTSPFNLLRYYFIERFYLMPPRHLDPRSPDPPQKPESLLILSDDHIIETIAKLQRRISERFPDSGLSNLCGQLVNVARQASTRSIWIGRPIIWIRFSGYLLAASVIALLIHTVRTIGLETEKLTFTEFVQTFEAGLNEVILIGAAIYFLISLEVRIKRRRALAAVHELRSMAHIIDMHQLTKDPERILHSWRQAESSPKVRMTPQELGRYLDYCSEMLSLTGKIAALYVRQFDDAVSVAAVSEVEQLSTGLSRKIWQKIMILSQFEIALTPTEATTARSPMPLADELDVHDRELGKSPTDITEQESTRNAEEDKQS